MKLSPIVTAMRDRCLFFERRVFGGIDWDVLEEAGKLPAPSAYVIVGDDDPEPNKFQNVSAQDVKDQFEVVVVLEAPDQKSLARIDQVHDVRALLVLALVGWEPAPEYDPIEYEGGQLVLINRHRLVYRFPVAADVVLARDALGEAIHAVALSASLAHGQTLGDARHAWRAHMSQVARGGLRIRSYTPAVTTPAVVLAYLRR